MKKNITISFITVGVFLLLLAGCSQKNIQQQDSNVPPAQKQFDTASLNQKADSVLAKMNLKEKVGQLSQFTSDMNITGPYMKQNYRKKIINGEVGSIFNAYGASYTKKLQKLAVDSTRLHIPLIFGYDVIHGFRTEFPVPLAESCTWDPKLIEKAARVAATEASSAGLQWTFDPMVDIARDPRWGRIVEGAGEDPYLGSAIARAKVHGFQGNNLAATNTVLACVKHYAAYGAVEAGRDYNTVDMSMRRLRSIYLPPYKAAIDAGAGSVMTAFITLNGEPATSNRFLLTKILRKEWGFKGFVVTDYSAVQELENHRVAKNGAQAAQEAINAGVDMDMQDGLFDKDLPKLVKEGKVKMSTINNAVRHVLRLKFKLGLFKNPYKYSDPQREHRDTMTTANLKLAREVAKKSIVLLKNKNNILPLSKKTKTIALLGPLANDQKDLLGPWHGAAHWQDVQTVLKGIKEVAPHTRILYDKGVDIKSKSISGFRKAIQYAKEANVAVLCVGESANMSGEAASRSRIGLPGKQLEFVKAIEKTGTPVVVVLMNGRPLTIPWMSAHVPGILETWFLGTESGPAIADVLFGNYNPSGKLTTTFPRDVGQIPIYYDHYNTGRPYQKNNKYTSKYLDVPNTPQYPFGYGLSYTTFKYTKPTFDKNTITTKDTLHVHTTITNTGKRAGEEIAQFYISEKYADVSPRVKELKGFTHVYLKPGESKQVTFTLTPKKMSMYNLHMEKVVEPGTFELMVGPNSAKVLTDTVRVVKPH